MIILKNTWIVRMSLVHCQIYQIFVNIDVPHASKHDQIMSIISDCEEIDASVMHT